MTPRPPSPSTTSLLVGALLLAAPTASLAQRAPSAAGFDFGLHGAWAPDVADGSFGIGFRAGRALGASLPGLGLQAALDILLPDCGEVDCGYWDLAIDLTYDLGRNGVAVPWFGAGLTYARQSGQDELLDDLDEGDIGFNVLAGARLDTSASADPFAELRWDLMSDLGDQLVLAVGVVF